MLRSMFERMEGTPCARCEWMGWDLLDDEPCGICRLMVRNRYGKLKSAAGSCRRNGFRLFRLDEVKAEKADAWAKRKEAREKKMTAISGMTAVTKGQMP